MRFRSDSRSQAIQIGAVLIFGLLIVVLASYQAFVVPSQNAEIEFNHHQDVERDMVDLRANILQAKTTGEDRFTTVRLGTQFPTRIIAQNPPNPGGTLRTSANRTLTFEGDDGITQDDFTDFEPENRFITYTPNYAEFREAGPIRYENTVVYKEFENANVLLSGQRLVQNDTISLVPVHREFQASGTQTVPVEPIPSAIQTEQGVENPTLTVGTELTEEGWVELLSDEIDDGTLDREDIEVREENGERVLELTLEGTFDVEYSPVGLDRRPFSDFEPGEDTDDINPAAPGDVRIVSSSRSHNNDFWTATFNNSADTINITEARVNFYAVGSGGTAETLEEIRVIGGEDYENLNWDIGQDFERFEPPVRLDGDGTETILDFHFNDVSNNDLFFVLTVTFETGERGTYFIGEAPDTGGGGGGSQN